MNKKATYQILSIGNADKIEFIGDSYTESAFSIEGKAYICKLSLFSDYNYESFAKAGDTYRGNLERIRKNLPIYHDKLSWRDIRPKYAFLVSYTNDLKYMDEEQYLNDLRAIIETVRGLGSIPIIATEYHIDFGPGIQIGLKQVASEYDCELIDITDAVRETRGTDYAPFWGGSHPGTRSNELFADNYEVYLNKLPRPRQSLKLFRVRKQYSDVEALVFHTNEERARLFKEINVGHMCLVDDRKVDDVTVADRVVMQSEYLKLQNGEEIHFENVALVSAVLPSTSLGLKHVALDIGDVEAEVYVKDIIKAPYPVPTFYQRFDIEKDYGVQVGDTYISDNPEFEGVTFTVKEVTDESFLMLPYPRKATSLPGKLTKVNGHGASEILYPYTSIGFSKDYPKGKAHVGHYVKLGKIDGKYEIPIDLLAQVVDYDKVHFMVVKPGAFSLNQVSLEWDGVEDKIYTYKPFKNRGAKGKELLSNCFAGTKEELEGWQIEDDAMPYIPQDGCLPQGCKGCVEISKEKKIGQLVHYAKSEKTRDVEVVVVARYFPPIFNSEEDYNKCLITQNSYDYTEICLDMSYNGRVYTQRRMVGLHWKKVKFDAMLPALTDEVHIKFYSEDYPIQFAKASMKEI